MSCIISYWDNLVGKNSHRIEDPSQKIELIQKEAFEQLMQFPGEFSYGLNLDNLPQGFYLKELDDEGKSKTVLCYSKTYFNQNNPNNPLAPTLKKNPIIQPIYHVVELNDHAAVTENYDLPEYRIFPHSSSDDRGNDVTDFFIYPPSEFEKDKIKFHNYFKKALENDDPLSFKELQPYYEEIAGEFNARNFKALTYVYLHSGTQGVLIFLTQMAKLKENGHYDQFKKVFLDNAVNFNTLNTLEARELIAQISQLTPNQLTWWNTLSEQHMKNNPDGDFTDLWKGYQYFLQELEKLGKSINKPLDLPSICPFEDVKHMKVGLDRLLGILNRSLDPTEQIKNLQGLDLSQDGAYYAHRYNNYLISASEMALHAEVPRGTPPLIPEKLLINNPSFIVVGEFENIDDRSFEIFTPHHEAMKLVFGENCAIYKCFDDGPSEYFLCRIDTDKNHNLVKKFHYIKSKEEKEDFINGVNETYILMKQSNDPEYREKLRLNFFKYLDESTFAHVVEIPKNEQDLALIYQQNVNYSCSLIDLYKYLTKLRIEVRNGVESLMHDKTANQPVVNFENQTLLFYRYIAQQPYSLSIEQYKTIIQKISSLHLNSETNAYLLLLIAQATTQKNQLQSDDIMKDIDNLLLEVKALNETEISMVGTEYNNAASEQLSLFVKNLWGFQYDASNNINEPKANINFPSINQLVTLLKLNDYTANRTTDYHLSKMLMKHTQLYGQNAFKAIEVLYNRAISLKPNHPTNYTENVYSQLTAILKSENLNTEEKGLLDIISLSVDFENKDKFTQTQAELCKEIANISDPEKRLNVLKILATIDVINTDTLPFCERIVDIVKAVNATTEMTKFADIFNFISGELPQVKFNRMEVSVQFQSILQNFPPLDFNEVVDNIKTFLTIDAKTESALIAAGELYNSNDSSQMIRGLSELINIVQDLTRRNPVFSALIKKVVETQVLDGVNKDLSAVVATKIDALEKKNDSVAIDNPNYIETTTLDSLKKILDKNCPMITYSEKLSEDIIEGSQFVSTINEFFTLIDQLQEHNSQQARLTTASQKAQHDLENLLKIYTTHHQLFTISGFTQLVRNLGEHEAFSADYQLETILSSAPKDLDEKRLTSLMKELISHKDHYPKNYMQVLKFVVERHKDENIELFIQHFAKIDAQYHKALLSIITHPELHTNDINKLLQNFSRLQGPIVPKLLNYMVNAENCEPQITFNYLKNLCIALEGESTVQILTILNQTHFNHRANNPEDLEKMIALVNGLKALKPEELQIISAMYQSPPSPSADQLLASISIKPLNIEGLIAQFERDPPGRRKTPEQINEQFDISAVERVISEMQDLFKGTTIPHEMRLELLHEFTFINAIGKDIPILTAEGKKKSLIEFSTQEVQALIKKIQTELKNSQLPPEERHQKRLLYLALLREAMYRTTGKFPYSTQILAVLIAFRSETNVLLQINTGEGKTLINALNSAMGCAEGRSQIIPTANLQLATEGLEENQQFYQFLGHEAAVIQASSPKGSFLRGGINYTDAGNNSLYLQETIMRSEDIFEGGQMADVLIDEADFAMLDERTVFILAASLEGVNTYHNPNAWIYPLINEFINTDEYKALCSPEDDVMNLRRYIYIKISAQDTLKEQLDKLSFKQLSRWIDSAVIASSYQEGIDYVIGTEQRMINGKMTEVQVAQIVNENGSVSTDSKWSKGVHQFLHAKLGFPIDAEMGYVSSETSKSFLDNFRGRGRIIGTSGTAGSSVEIEELRRKFNLDVFKIPPHKKNLRQYLQPSFGAQAKFGFTAQSQLQLIKSALNKSHKKRGQQPVLIICKDISHVREMAKQLQEYQQKGYTIQVVTGEESSAELDAARKQAAKKGVITISTPIFSRGTDIKTQHEHGLFVIQSYFDRFRMMCQILGRAARDSLIGYYQPIYNVEEIAAEFGVSLKGKSRKQKIALLEKIQIKLDTEAQMERKYSHLVGDINNLLQKQLNIWLKKMQSQPELQGLQKELLKIKSQLINDLEDKWNELLEKSDPTAEHPNPYIRYDQSNKLAEEALVKCMEEYEKEATKLWNEAQVKIKELINAKTDPDYCETHLRELLGFDADQAIAQIQSKPESILRESVSDMRLNSLNADEPNTAFLRYYPESDTLSKKQRQLLSYINQFKKFTAEAQLNKIPTRQGRRLHRSLNTIIATLNPEMTTPLEFQKNISEYTQRLMEDYIKNYSAYAKAGIKLNQFYAMYLEPLVNMVDANPSGAEVLIHPLREQLSAAYFKALESGKIENASLITDLATLLRDTKLKNVFKDPTFDELIYNNPDHMEQLSNLKGLAILALSDYRKQLLGRPVSADRIEACKTLEKEIATMPIENFDDMLDNFNRAIDKCFNSTIQSDIDIDQKRQKITGKAFTRRTVGRLRPLLVSLKEISLSIRPVEEKKDIKDFNALLELELKKYNEILTQSNTTKRNMPDSKQSQLKRARINFHKIVETELKNPEHSETIIKFLLKNKNHPLVRKNNFETLLTLLPKFGPRT